MSQQICIDGVVRVLKSDTVTPGSTLMATASVNVNNAEITIGQIPLLIKDNSTFTDIFLVKMFIFTFTEDNGISKMCFINITF